MNERPYVNVQVRMPREIHTALMRVADDHHRSLHGELLHVAQVWTRLAEADRLTCETKAQPPPPA